MSRGKDFTTMPVIETRNLTYTYSPGTPFEKTAMKDVSLSVERGDLSA